MRLTVTSPLRAGRPLVGCTAGLIGLLFASYLDVSVPLDAGGGSGKFAPPRGTRLLVVGQDLPNIEAYVASVGIVPAGFAAYTSIQALEGLTAPANEGGGLQNAQALIEQYPDTVIQLALYMVGASESVTDGALDANIDRLAGWLRSVKRPVFLRIGCEFDYPDNAYEPTSYVRAYRHVVDRLRARQVTNVAFVWHSYASTVNRPHEDWYPGDDYVDWFGISYFDQPARYMHVVADISDRHHKPLMIAESSPWRLPTNVNAAAWVRWFVPMLRFAGTRHVGIISYINCDWDRIPMFREKQWGDTRIQSNPDLRRTWIREISQRMYLKSSPNLFHLLGYHPD